MQNLIKNIASSRNLENLSGPFLGDAVDFLNIRDLGMYFISFKKIPGSRVLKSPNPSILAIAKISGKVFKSRDDESGECKK
ncbi:MAG: hypothetical protein BGO67_02865 [Alphaproteobacteria bacterium 41-28]|nr:MAG: hypothetical protein BGO67_02865 [Alphaproteobacteria bacterium 41-28]